MDSKLRRTVTGSLLFIRQKYMLLYRKNIKGGIVYETYLKHAVGN